MQDDEYELMPRTELEYLRKEVDKLKRNPLGDTQASITLLDSINKLNTNISRLNDIFAGANDDLVKSFNNASLQEQLGKLQENQEKLARGIVAVADLVKKVEVERGSPLPPIEQFAPKPASPPQINAQAISADLQASQAVPQSRNPFDSRQDFKPLLNEPLPRPGALGADLPPLPPLQKNQQVPQFNAQPPTSIPEADIPPPPPRRY